MNDARFAFRQVAENPGFTAGAASLRRGLLSRLLCAVARRNFEARDQPDVHSLIIVGFIMPENEHFTPAGGQGDEIRMFHQQTATVSHVNEKGAEGLGVEQLPDVIRFHVFNVIGISGFAQAQRAVRGLAGGVWTPPPQPVPKDRSAGFSRLWMSNVQ